MANYDLAAMDAALKELYDGQKVENLVYSDNPTLAMIPKKTGFGGKRKPIPLQYGIGQGASASFAKAKANQTAASLTEFLMTRRKFYSLATIDNETMMASATDKMSFLEAAELAVDGAYQVATLEAAQGLFRSGSGTIGVIGSISSGVITLSEIQDVVFFERGMVLQANATDGGVPRAALGYVIAVDRDLGKVTVSASAGGSAGTPSGWVGNDFLLRDGGAALGLQGFAAWLPDVAPTAGDNFMGVDRSVDTTRLAGIRFDASSQSVEEGIIDACSRVAREGGKSSHLITNFVTYAALEKALGAKVQYVDLNKGEINFRGIAINGPTGVIKVMPDRSCQAKKGWLLQMNTWALESLGSVPQMLEQDNNKMLRVSDADAAELRVGYYANVSCNAPGYNANVKFGV